MANIKTYLNNIKTAVFGSEVRDSIHDAIQQCYDDASAKDNANMEVKMARGEYENLGKRLDSHSSQIKDIKNEKATKQEVEVERQRINSLTTLENGSTTGDAELIDARIGIDGVTYSNLGNAVRGQANKLKNDLCKIVTPLSIIETIGYYFDLNGELISDTTAAKCCYTNKIRVYGGSEIIWEIGNFQYPHYLWGAYILYDENENVIGTRKDFVNTSTEVNTSSGVISIPNNAKYIAFTYRTFGERNMFSGKNLYSKDSIEQLLLTVDENKDDLDNLKYFNYDMLNGRKGWIRHGTGEFVYSDATKCYVFNKNNLTHFKAFLKSDTDVIDGISFFSGTEISESTYLDSSIAWKGNYQNGAWYDVTIPKDANLICVTSGIQNGFVPKILFSTDEVLGVTDNKYKNSIELNTNNIVKLQKDIHSKNDVALYGLDRYIYHFGMEEVAIRTEIPPVVPSQSIYDVQYAKKLGYKCIEGNLHKTQDGKYVVTHGMNGCLGHDFDDLEGNDAYGVVIAETSFETLRNNYRYRSSNEKYRVSITSLEEFCAEVKKEGLILMLQYNDIDSLNIARGILGDNNLFMYNAPRQDYDGAILEYLYYNTKEEILNRCRLVGKPYIYSMDNPSKFDDDTLKDIVNSLHEEGFYIASAYVGNGEKYLKMGFDFIARDGKSKELRDNEIVIDNKVLTFNLDGSVSWRDL